MFEDSAAKYYQKNNERLQKKLGKDIKVFLKKEKETKQYGCERYKNLSEDEKQKLVEKKPYYNYEKLLF